MAAKYRMIAEIIGKRIDDGTYPIGSTLPSAELENEFQVNTRTLRQAFGVLEDLGMVIVRQGAGTIVRDTSPANASADSRPGSSRVALTWTEQHADGSAELLSATRTVADAEIASILEIEPGSPVVLRERLYRKGVGKVSTQQQWIPGFVADAIHAKLGIDIGDPAVRIENIFEAMDQAEYDPVDIVEVNSSRSADELEESALDVPSRFKVLDCQRLCRTASGVVVEFSFFVGAGDRHKTVYRVQRTSSREA